MIKQLNISVNALALSSYLVLSGFINYSILLDNLSKNFLLSNSCFFAANKSFDLFIVIADGEPFLFSFVVVDIKFLFYCFYYFELFLSVCFWEVFFCGCRIGDILGI